MGLPLIHTYHLSVKRRAPHIIHSKANMAARLADTLLARDRAALSRAITLAESRAPRHREAINTDVEHLGPRTDSAKRFKAEAGTATAALWFLRCL